MGPVPFCPNCGKEVSETDRFCPSCGALLISKEAPPEAVKEAAGAIQKTGAMEALNKGVGIISAKPMVLMPALLGAVISAVLSTVASLYFIGWGLAWLFLGLGGPGVVSLFIGLLLLLIGGIIAYILFFASLDMSRDAYLNQELNLSESINYVIKRIGTFIVASIVGAILAITIILIPVAILMFVIIVVDETGIGDAVSKALKVLGDRLADVIILLIIAIVVGFILGLIPFVGSILSAAFNVLIALAFIDIYFNYKKTKTY